MRRLRRTGARCLLPKAFLESGALPFAALRQQACLFPRSPDKVCRTNTIHGNHVGEHNSMPDDNRRPIAVRSSGWARATAAWLARSAITPNQISCSSVGFALAGRAALRLRPDMLGLLLCTPCILLRLPCNLFDGMVAVEAGKGAATGALFNEVPDRLGDSLFLAALGYAVMLP